MEQVVLFQFLVKVLILSMTFKKHKTPHNNFLYIFFEIGFLGLLVFLSLFYFQIKDLISNKSTTLDILILPFFYLFLMLFDSYLFIFTITILYIFLCILYIKVTTWIKNIFYKHIIQLKYYDRKR